MVKRNPDRALRKVEVAIAKGSAVEARKAAIADNAAKLLDRHGELIFGSENPDQYPTLVLTQATMPVAIRRPRPRLPGRDTNKPLIALRHSLDEIGAIELIRPATYEPTAVRDADPENHLAVFYRKTTAERLVVPGVANPESAVLGGVERLLGLFATSLPSLTDEVCEFRRLHDNLPGPDYHPSRLGLNPGDIYNLATEDIIRYPEI